MSILTTEAYDPDAPEGAKPKRSQYISRRDIIVVAIALPIFGVFMWPVIKNMLEDSNNAVCIRNLTSIKSAMLVYATSYDDRFPPLYVEGDNRSPQVFNGAPNTWATVISGSMSKYASFTCPSAQAEENTPSLSSPSFSNKNMALSYGMYVPRAGRPANEVSDPSIAALIAETANMGSRHSFDPYEYVKTDDTVVPYDGMSIGWDNSNFSFTKDSHSVSRLAFYQDPKDRSNVESRHREHVNYLSVDGTLHRIGRDKADVIQSGNRLIGIWEAR